MPFCGRGGGSAWVAAWLCLLLAVCLTGGRSLSAQDTDPGTPGPLAVTLAEYDFGDAALRFPSFPVPVEFRGVAHHPSDLSGGPYPLLVLLHGMHATVTDGKEAFGEWPPPPGFTAVPNHHGYDYVAANLASHGYVVVSISSNGVTAGSNDVEDLGMDARARLLERHLAFWGELNTRGAEPFGTRFAGKIDLTRVGMMGHSRGGEGVVAHYRRNLAAGAPVGLRAVLALAPTDFLRLAPTRVPFAVILPYCDGDVTDLQGIHFYDDTRYLEAGDPAPRHSILLLGANHNFFNSVWSPSSGIPGSFDDWLESDPGRERDPDLGTGPGSIRLTEEPQRAAGLVYIAAFFRTYVGGETGFRGILTGTEPPPPSAGSPQVHVSYHAPDMPEARRDLSRVADRESLRRNTLGGTVRRVRLSPYEVCGGPPPQESPCVRLRPDSPYQQPHTSPSRLAPEARGPSQLHVGWGRAGGGLSLSVPAGSGDLRGFSSLRFRAGLNPFDVRFVRGRVPDVTVTLADAGGRKRSTSVRAWSAGLYSPPGQAQRRGFRVVPKLLLNSVRVPLSAFPGVALDRVRSVRIGFPRSSPGSLVLSDMAFTHD